MKRNQIVGLLVKEGFSQSTLVVMSDKQLEMLSERILGEQAVSGKGKVKMPANTPPDKIKQVTDGGIDVELTEKLVGKQKKLDKNHNGKIDGQDFKILKNKKKLDKKKLEDIDKKEIKEWVDSLVENDYHSLTTKDEIMELIKIKLHEQPDVMEPDIDVEPDIDIDPDIDAPPSPDKDPFIDPWQNPGEGPDPRPKFEKGNGGSMPAFMEFKNILKSMNQPKGADSISESIMKKIRNVLKNGK